jgi:exodeoxyribonuclease VII large subunit
MQSIRKHLQDAGIWDRNRSLPRPTDFVRVSVIAPAGAAGLGDFRSTADRLAGSGLAEFIYHEVPFQTREAPARIVDALRGIYRECSSEAGRHCAVAIIRGGGPSADLAWLVDPKLAEAVCRMNVPVMTGIGHERDRNLLDEIACIPCDTPSKVAEYINSTIIRAALDGRRAYEAIQTQAAHVLNRHETAFTSARNDIDRDARETIRLAEGTVRAAAVGMEPGARSLLENTKLAVASASEDVRAGARHRREAAMIAMQGFHREMAASIESMLRPLDVGTERALGEIVARADGLPQSASDDVTRLQTQITDDAGQITSLAGNDVAEIRGQVSRDAVRILEDCYSTIRMVVERADALHPRTVLAAGYAILRDRRGSPLTSSEGLRSADLIAAEMRDGVTHLRIDQSATSEDKSK